MIEKLEDIIVGSEDFKSFLAKVKRGDMAKTVLLISKDSDYSFEMAKFLSCLIFDGDMNKGENYQKVCSDSHPDLKVYPQKDKLYVADSEEIVFENSTYYSFPTAEQLKNATEEDFREIGTGYRAPYLVKCVNAVLNGEIKESDLLETDTASAREKVMSLYGVGDKVCDCVMLFSLKKYDLFPSDVWIKRVMCEYFSSNEKDAKKDGERLFGSLSGFAQQYLFYYRKNMD